MRDKEETKKKLTKAITSVLERDGFGAVGVNAVAREAGADKALIYRYFGGFAGLLKKWAQEEKFWPEAGELAGGTLEERESLKTRAAKIMVSHYRNLHKRRLTAEIMRWELAEKSDFARLLSEMREERTNEVLACAGIDPSDFARNDMDAAAAVVHAGLTYLVLRAKTAGVYMGVNLRSKEGRAKIERAAAALIEAFVEKHETFAAKEAENEEV